MQASPLATCPAEARRLRLAHSIPMRICDGWGNVASDTAWDCEDWMEVGSLFNLWGELLANTVPTLSAPRNTGKASALATAGLIERGQGPAIRAQPSTTKMCLQAFGREAACRQLCPAAAYCFGCLSSTALVGFAFVPGKCPRAPSHEGLSLSAHTSPLVKYHGETSQNPSGNWLKPRLCGRRYGNHNSTTPQNLP